MLVRELLTTQQLEWLEKLKTLGDGEILINGEVYEDDTGGTTSDDESVE